MITTVVITTTIIIIIIIITRLKAVWLETFTTPPIAENRNRRNEHASPRRQFTTTPDQGSLRCAAPPRGLRHPLPQHHLCHTRLPSPPSPGSAQRVLRPCYLLLLLLLLLLNKNIIYIYIYTIYIYIYIYIHVYIYIYISYIYIYMYVYIYIYIYIYMRYGENPLLPSPITSASRRCPRRRVPPTGRRPPAMGGPPSVLSRAVESARPLLPRGSCRCHASRQREEEGLTRGLPPDGPAGDRRMGDQNGLHDRGGALRSGAANPRRRPDPPDDKKHAGQETMNKRRR